MEVEVVVEVPEYKISIKINNQKYTLTQAARVLGEDRFNQLREYLIRDSFSAAITDPGFDSFTGMSALASLKK